MTSQQQEIRSNWGRWGDEDERGALNLLTPEVVMRAAGTVRTGKVYPLGLPIDAESAPLLEGRGEPRRLTLTCDSDADRYAALGAAPGVGGNQDVLMMASHHGTHIDALSHVYADNVMYNGFASSTFKAYSGAGKLGIDKLGAFAARAVVLDMAGHAGVDVLPGGHVITGSDLADCAEADGVQIRAGDILLIRTGWLEAWRAGTVEQRAGQAGIGMDAARFVAEHDIVAVGSDNAAVEVLPFDEGVFLAVHIALLVKLGVPLIEHLDLSALARDQVRECLLCVAPLPVTGAGGSPVNPVAIA